MSEDRWIVCAFDAEGANGWRNRKNDESGRIWEEREGARHSGGRIGQKMERDGENERCDRHLREPSKTPLWRKEGGEENWQQRQGSKRVLTDTLHLMKSYLATSVRHTLMNTLRGLTNTLLLNYSCQKTQLSGTLMWPAVVWEHWNNTTHTQAIPLCKQKAHHVLLPVVWSALAAIYPSFWSPSVHCCERSEVMCVCHRC